MRFWSELARDVDYAKRQSVLFRWLCALCIAVGGFSFVFVLIAFFGVANAKEPERSGASRFVWQLTRDAGGAVIQNAFGGEYVYSDLPEIADGRIAQRFSIGRPVRLEYTLFSAEEEEALWNLRDKERHRNDPPLRSLVHSAAKVSRAPMPNLNWPKVVALADRVCVPNKGFEDADDWREHLVCWLKEAQRVE